VVLAFCVIQVSAFFLVILEAAVLLDVAVVAVPEAAFQILSDVNFGLFVAKLAQVHHLLHLDDLGKDFVSNF
jgi:hypothetical protein